MSYFSYLGDSLNNAIENVGNIVAPVDDSFDEEDAMGDGAENDAPPEDPRLGLEIDGYSNSTSSSQSKIIAQQIEEIEFLTTKVQSLSIELADRAEREGSLQAQVAELNEKLCDLEEKGMDSWMILNQKQKEAEEAVLRLQDCEAALRASESACQALQGKMHSAALDGATPNGDRPAEHERCNRLPAYMSAIRVITKELSTIVNDSQSAGEYFRLQDDRALDDMIDSWSADASTGLIIGNDEMRRGLKECMWFVGEVLNRMVAHREGWIEISEGANGLRESLELCGVGGEPFGGEATYNSVKILVLSAAKTLSDQLQLNKALSISFDAAKVSHQELEKQFEHQIKELSRELNDARQSFNKQSAEKSDLMNEISMLREENAKFKNERSETIDSNALIDKMEEEIKRLNQQVQQLQLSITDLQSKKVLYEGTSKPADNIDDILLENERLSKELDTAQSLLAASNKESSVLLEQLSSISAIRESDNAEIKRLTQLVECTTEKTENILKNEMLLQESNAVLRKESTSLNSALDEALQGQKDLSARLKAETEMSNRAANEIQRLKIEVARLDGELSDARISLNQSSDSGELRAAKMQLQKLEHEQKQLHQVIAQLRQARKSSKEDSDGAVADRDYLKKSNDLLVSENSTLKLSLSEKTQQLEQVTRRLQEVSSSYNSISSEVKRGEQENNELYQRLETAEQTISELSKQLFDAEARVETLQADLSLARQDLSFKDTELYNLQNAIDGLGRDADHNLEMAKQDFKRKLSEAEEKYEKALLSQEQSFVKKVVTLEESLKESQQREVDESLLRRKAEMEGAVERKRLQAAVEQAIMRLQNSSEDVVDRAVVANLFVSYFKKNRSKEILELIGRMLCFTDEQKVAVGLLVAPRNVNPVGYISSLIGGMVTGPGNRPEEDIKIPEGESLAEMWVNFLLEESDGKQPSGQGLPGNFSTASSRTGSFSTVHLSTPGASPVTGPGSPNRDTYSSSFMLTPPSPKIDS